MIADQPSPPWTAGLARDSGTRVGACVMTRRRLLVLGAASAAGVLAGCGLAPTSTSLAPRPSTTPTPLTPTASITAANASRIRALGVLPANDRRLRGVAWSPDGSLVAAGGQFNVHLWNVQTGKPVATWRGHTSQINAVAWSATNSLVASASDDGTIRVWQPSDGSVTHVLGGMPNDPISLSWSPDGTLLVAGDYFGRVLVWDVQRGRVVSTRTGPPLGGGRGAGAHAVYTVAWSPDGARILTTRYDGWVLVWEGASGSTLAALQVASQPNGVAWSPDGRRFSSSHDDGTVHLWDAATDHSISVLAAHPGDGWAFPLAWSPDGTVLAVARETGLVQWYDARQGSELAALQGHSAPVWALRWAPNGLRVATASDDGTVRLWGVH